ncbi:MAG: YicC/YloC family endoribonuclease, partial [Candidatus Rokuibacteriota bacterium]
MIRSMTGYGRAEATGARTILSAECRSVNHRHLDISLKLPRVL